MDPRAASPKRQSWDEYFIRIAEEVATRSTCNRKHVGAVIVRERSILATGYNGSIRGMPHCDDVGHLMVNDHCIRTVHAEANAIAQAARNGVRIEGASRRPSCSSWPVGFTTGTRPAQSRDRPPLVAIAKGGFRFFGTDIHTECKEPPQGRPGPGRATVRDAIQRRR